MISDANQSHAEVEETESGLNMTAAVIGCGILGSRISLELASLGINVNVFDRGLRADQVIFKLNELQDEYIASMSSTALSSTEKKEHFDAACNRVKGANSLAEAVDGAALVSEAIVEDLSIKIAVICEIEEHCPPDCLITTNSLTIPIAQLQGQAKRPLQVLGLRFLYPVLFIPYTELSRTVRHYTNELPVRTGASDNSDASEPANSTMEPTGRNKTREDNGQVIETSRVAKLSRLVRHRTGGASAKNKASEPATSTMELSAGNETRNDAADGQLIESSHVARLRQLLDKMGKTAFESEPLQLLDTLRNVMNSRGEYRLRLSNTESSRHQNREARVRTSKDLGAFTKVDGCVICLDGPCEVLSVACGHNVLCRICAREMAIRRCPLCRVEINRHLGFVGS